MAYKYMIVIVAHFLFSSAKTQPLALYFAHVRFILFEPGFINVSILMSLSSRLQKKYEHLSVPTVTQKHVY